MRFLGLSITRERKSAQGLSLDALLSRLDALASTAANIQVTPESALRSPTVQAIVTAVTGKMATLPLHVYQRQQEADRTRKVRLHDHPIAQLLERPNGWQSRTDYMLDSTSRLVRYGNFYAHKSAGRTGPVRRLEPLHPNAVDVEQADDLSVTYRVSLQSGAKRDYTPAQIHHVRLGGTDGLTGASPVMLAREAIAVEIAAEQFGAEFFGKGAMPGLVFGYQEGQPGFATDEERNRFLASFDTAHGKGKRFRALLLPKGIDLKDPIAIDNEKNQLIETRKFQRAVIAAAFGVPQHLVGDLSKATFNNIEQQSLDFIQNVILPYVRILEAALERDLLTPEDRANGIIVRFNLDGSLRGDFKSRQEGLKIQRDAGVINPNDWREMESMNPISAEDGGEDYWRQGPSGQTAAPKPSNGGSGEDDGSEA